MDVDQRVKECYRPIQAGRECAHGGWCTECTLSNKDPSCRAAMVWLLDHWQWITFQGKPLDGTICGFQQYLHIQDGVCPPPDDKLICQNNICIHSPTYSTTSLTSKSIPTPTTSSLTKLGETWAPTEPPTLHEQTFSPTNNV